MKPHGLFQVIFYYDLYIVLIISPLVGLEATAKFWKSVQSTDKLGYEAAVYQGVSACQGLQECYIFPRSCDLSNGK